MADATEQPVEGAPSPPPEEGAGQPVGGAGRAWRKWILRIFASLAAILLVGLAVLNSPIGHRFVADQIARVAPAPFDPARMLIDKSPLFLSKAVLIQRLFPDARFILALRHPASGAAGAASCGQSRL